MIGYLKKKIWIIVVIGCVVINDLHKIFCWKILDNKNVDKLSKETYWVVVRSNLPKLLWIIEDIRVGYTYIYTCCEGIWIKDYSTNCVNGSQTFNIVERDKIIISLYQLYLIYAIHIVFTSRRRWCTLVPFLLGFGS